MFRQHLAASLLLVSFCFLGCSSSTPPASSSTSSSTDDTAASDVIETSITSAPGIDPAGIATKSPEEHMELVQDTFKKAMDDQSIEGLNESIELASTAVKEHPTNGKLLQLKALLLFQSLQIEPDKQKATDRRLEMGEIARSLLAMHKEDTSKLGQMPNVLLFEEAKAHLANRETAKAWSTLKQAHANGFDQPRVLYLDPAFEPLAAVAEYDTEMRGWVKDEMATVMADFQTFPFVFSLKSLNGNEEGGEPKEVSLTDFKGKPIIVDFWGTWCPPCRAALPHLVELHEKHKGELVVLGINFERDRAGAKNYEEAKQILDKFVEKEPLPYTCLYGQQGLTDQVPDFSGFPTMVFVDRKGIARLSLTGYNPAPVLEAIVDTLMAGK